MELTCSRCHQPVAPDHTFCPACGLPQLVYSTESAEAQPQGDRWTAAIQDASTVEWRAAMRFALLLALPAGLLSSASSPLNSLGVFWMAAAAAWAVVLYVRSGRGTAWVTMGAGARIGLVTGILGAWLTFALSGGALFTERYWLHSTAETDTAYKASVEQVFSNAEQQTLNGMEPGDQEKVKAVWGAMQQWMLSPWGRAGVLVAGLSAYSLFLLFFAVGGGAVSARLMARARLPRG